MLIEFNTDAGSISIVDHVERRRVTLDTWGAVSPTPAETDSFPYPVDRAVEIVTDEITTRETARAFVMDGDGSTVAQVRPEDDAVTLPPDTYAFDIGEAVKVYVFAADGPGAEVVTDPDEFTTTISFDEPTRILVGARSLHEEPAATITTTDDLADVMRAISHFGSALKDTSPMRSYPTLRGHPPDIERGDDLHVPDDLAPPDTGITIEVPPNAQTVYATASPAFYLGAAVEPGDVPRIVTDDGFEHRLDTSRGVRGELERVLKQTFILDVATRTAGPYDYTTDEYADLSPELAKPVDDLYDAPIAERLRYYLDVPFDAVEANLPEWPVAARVAPTSENVEALPHLANDLATIHPPTVDSRTADVDTTAPVVTPEPLDASYRLWLADGAPVGASKPAVGAYRAALGREPIEGTIDYAVVCNDPTIANEEETVSALLSNPTGLDIDIRPYRELYRNEMQALLERGADVFHFIGDTDDGFVCTDGELAPDELESLSVDAFVLTAIDSYDAGMDLLDAGAASGVAILGDVPPGAATSVGQLAAQLINLGFSVGQAVDVATRTSEYRDQFVVLGDATYDITQPYGVPVFTKVLGRDGDTLSVEMHFTPSNDVSPGSILMPTIVDVERPILAGKTVRSTVAIDELLAVDPPVPVQVAGGVYLSDVLSRDDF